MRGRRRRVSAWLENWTILTELESSMIAGISVALKPVMILFSVGMLIGSWILSGTVPTMIYYSLLILDPAIFYAASCVICALISLSIGSSWTVAGTVGIALIGAAGGLGVSVRSHSGCDNFRSLLRRQTVSAFRDHESSTGSRWDRPFLTHWSHVVDDHSEHCNRLDLVYIMGLNIDSEAANTDLELTMRLISDTFTIHPIMLLPVLTLLVMANKKFPPVPTILAGASLAVLLALIFQRPAVLALAGETQNIFLAYFRGVWQTLFDGFSLNSGNTTLDDLMTRGGMSSMLNTVWLILCAMIFGAVMEHTGLLKCLVNYALSFVSSTGSLIATTLLTCIGANLITSDQYISVVLPGRMYKLEFQNHNLDMKNLSRTLEDAGTITSPLIPWNTCGAYGRHPRRCHLRLSALLFF